jgi:hypothetical protein
MPKEFHIRRTLTYSYGQPGTCLQCLRNVTHFLWTDASTTGFALPCGHHPEPIQLSPEDLALALLTMETV